MVCPKGEELQDSRARPMRLVELQTPKRKMDGDTGNDPALVDERSIPTAEIDRSELRLASIGNLNLHMPMAYYVITIHVIPDFARTHPAHNPLFAP
jgi:hypothetical protein